MSTIQHLNFVESSNYLRGIELEKARKLLEDRYDYPGVKEILQYQFDQGKNDVTELKYVEFPLDSAIQWNFAEFETFKDKLLNPINSGLSVTLRTEIEERTTEKNWWWTAYEAAWLGVVRLKQNNSVEAMFHSYRALEGLAIKYAFRKGLQRHGKKLFRYLKSQKQKQWREHPFINSLIDLDTEDAENDSGNDILIYRNTLFHQLSGFTRNDLFEAWQTTEEDWQTVVLECLNFVSDQTFTDLKQVSLMAKVHQELIRAIATL